MRTSQIHQFNALATWLCIYKDADSLPLSPQFYQIENFNLFFTYAAVNKLTEQAILSFSRPATAQLLSAKVKHHLRVIKRDFIFRKVRILQENNQLIDFIKKKDLRVIAYKEAALVSYPNGIDIDLLVSDKDAQIISTRYQQRGYSIIHGYPYEYICLNPATGVAIELHTLIAHKHYEDRYDMLVSITQDMLRSVKRSSSPIGILPPRLFVVSRILIFWYNDYAFDLKSLAILSDYVTEHEHRINWKQLALYTKKTHIYRVSGFVMKLALSLFQQKPPKGLIDEFPYFFGEHLLQDYTLDTYVFRAVESAPDNAEQAKQREHGVIDILLSDNMSFWRLARPRVIYMMILLISRYATKKLRE